MMITCIWSTLLLAVLAGVGADHFRGGTISWKPTSNPNEAEFTFHMGWQYGRGPGCTPSKIGHFVNDTQITGLSWMCTKGCGSIPVPVAGIGYYCSTANRAEMWEYGENTFTYTFPGQGPFTVSFQGTAWMQLEGGKGKGDWNLETVVDFRQRSDTGHPNSSPVTLSKPMYYAQFGCHHTIQIPVFDPDGDRVHCRMAIGAECISVCDALPGITLDPNNCTITFNATASNTYTPGGWYAVAITVEDSPIRHPVTIGSQTYNPGDVMTAIPLQFLIQTPLEQLPCDWHPVFVNDTPAAGQQVIVKAGQTMNLKLYASNFMNQNAK